MNSLVATSIAVSVLAALALQYGQQRIELFRQNLGTAQGQQMDVLGGAGDSYVAKNFRTLVGQTTGILKADGTAGAVVAQLAPTVAELKTLGFLAMNFNATNYFGGGYQIDLAQSGTCPNNCTITGTVALTTPIVRDNVVDTSVLGAALGALGADGGFSKSGAGATIVGWNAGWTAANPVAGQPAGILASRIGTNATRFNTMYRLDGGLPLTAALQMGGNQITNLLAAVPGTTACATKGDFAQDSTTGAPVYCDGSQYKSIGGAANWVANKAALPLCNAASKGQIYVAMTPTIGTGPRAYTCDGAANWQPLAVDDNGTLTLAGNFSAKTVTSTLVVNASDSCAGYPTGAQAQDATGSPLYCQSNAWTTQGSSGVSQPSVASLNGRRTVASDNGSGYSPCSPITGTGVGCKWFAVESGTLVLYSPGRWEMCSLGADMGCFSGSAAGGWYWVTGVGVTRKFQVSGSTSYADMTWPWM